jgi:predicted acyltransferase
MLVGVRLRSFFVVMDRMKMVPVRNVRMMGSLMMVALLVMFCCFTVVSRSLLEMLCRLVMVFDIL